MAKLDDGDVLLLSAANDHRMCDCCHTVKNKAKTIIPIIMEGKSFKLHRLTGLTAYAFAGLANSFCGGLWLSTFRGGLRRLTMTALGYTSYSGDTAG